MTKQELIRDLKKETGSSFVTISGIARYMGMGRDTVRNEITAGLEYIESGRSKSYFVGDIAQRIIERRRA